MAVDVLVNHGAFFDQLEQVPLAVGLFELVGGNGGGGRTLREGGVRGKYRAEQERGRREPGE